MKKKARRIVKLYRMKDNELGLIMPGRECNEWLGHVVYRPAEHSRIEDLTDGSYFDLCDDTFDDVEVAILPPGTKLSMVIGGLE